MMKIMVTAAVLIGSPGPAVAQDQVPPGNKSEGATPAVEGAEDEVEVDETLDDAAFIVPEEDEEDDVTDIIGDGIEDDEET